MSRQLLGKRFLQLIAERWIAKHDVDIYACTDCGVEDEPDNNLPDPTACYANLKDVLHSNMFEYRQVNAAELDISKYDKTYMMLKYGTPEQGGWHIAYMSSTEEKDEMQLHFCFSDNKRALWLCNTKLLVSQPPSYYKKLPSRSWFLIQESTPGQSANPAAVSNPANVRVPGRPQTKRKGPMAGGPLS